MDAFKYFAFISYSHKDKKEAKELYRRLTYYRLPVGLAGEVEKKEGRKLPKKLSPIFLDDEEMAKSSVQAAMTDGLSRSKYLIVVCSPNSAKSEYCNSEVQQFIAMGRGDKIIPYIIEGTPCSGNPATECYPEAMRDPDRLGADVQALKKDAVLRVIATMLEVDLGVLLQRERKRRERIIIGVSAAIITLVTAFAIYNNRMRSLIADENLKFRTSLSNQYLQTGASLQSEGDEQKALLYYSEALKTNPSNLAAKMGALVSVQKQDWCTSVAGSEAAGAVSQGQNSDAASQGQNSDAVTASASGAAASQYGEYIKSGEFGHSSYDVYQNGNEIVLLLKDSGKAFTAPIPQEVQGMFADPSGGMISASLVGRDGEIRMVVLKDESGLIYSFGSPDMGNAEPVSGELVNGFYSSQVAGQFSGESNLYVEDVYGAESGGLAVIVFGYPHVPILYDVFENAGIRSLDLNGDYIVSSVAFDEKGSKIAVLTKKQMETLIQKSSIHFYNTEGYYMFSARLGDDDRLSHNIEFSRSEDELLYCSDDAIFVISSLDGTMVCPPVGASKAFERAEYTESGAISAVFTDGSAMEYETRSFRPAVSYDVPEPGEQTIDSDVYNLDINENIYITVRDSDIVLMDQSGVVDRAEGILNLPEGLNDGQLWNPGFSIDREAKVCYCYGYMENVFYRVRYDEENAKIVEAEPIVLDGKQSLSVNAFDDMCAVWTADRYLLGYRDDSNVPFFAMQIPEDEIVEEMKWLGNDILAVIWKSNSEETHSLQLWDVKKAIPVVTLERDEVVEMKSLHYSDGILSYWKGITPVYRVLEAQDPDSAAVDFLSGLTCYELDDSGMAVFDVPAFSGGLGNWGDVVAVE